MAAIAKWNAAAVVTLVEEHELKALGVEGLGEAVREGAHDLVPPADPRRGRAGRGVRARLADLGPSCAQMIRAGFNVLVHCKGGLGRAGTIASRLLIELGMEPEEAITRVREARPGAIETAAQLAYVRGCQRYPDEQPDRAPRPGATARLAPCSAWPLAMRSAPRSSSRPRQQAAGDRHRRRRPVRSRARPVDRRYRDGAGAG